MTFHSQNLQLDSPVGEKHETSPDRIFTGRLGNGMDVIVISDHRGPIATHMVWYRNGSADDPIGKSGIAHFLEHLMFKGTRNHSAKHFSGLLESVGGNENASTSWSYTNYYQRVPKDYLKICMAYEADRMTGLILTDEIVDMERQVVLAERGTCCDSVPQNILGEALQAGAFPTDPCGRPIIGWQHEIETLGREDALAYYHRFYTPENAILIVAGDVDPDAVMDMAETIYGAITPTGASFNRPVVHAPPVRTQRLLTLVDENVHQPAFTRIHVVPSMMATGPHAAALEVLAILLGGGNTSYLHEALIVNNRMAISVGASYWSDVFRGLTPFQISAWPAPGVSLTDLDDAIENALETLRRTGFSADDIQRAKTGIVANTIYQKDDHFALAWQYGVAASLGLRVEDVALWQDRITGVTTEDIRNALTLLERSTGIVGYLTPPATDA
ncbi:M16 family metallopeptidase [Rhizobium leguminosarum]|uniref:M16 family metallopeptidase n=1 Tax=Rhizobium leguminosarum TaxID=384 RepID=UPI000483FE24|nr:pitrilysin family protein [Rhizobium leguminosarum]